MNVIKLVGALAPLALVVACATPGPAPVTQQDGSARAAASQKVKSRDGSFDGEVIGRPAAGSRFSKLQIGMQMNEVQDALGRAPDRWHTYESGKRWIPFYFGNDARRMQVLYNNEGCLIFTSGNAWGGSGGDLISIEHDASGACYKP